MPISQIIEELQQERERIDKAITALAALTEEDTTSHRGGKKWTASQRRKFKATMATRKNGK